MLFKLKSIFQKWVSWTENGPIWKPFTPWCHPLLGSTEGCPFLCMQGMGSAGASRTKRRFYCTGVGEARQFGVAQIRIYSNSRIKKWMNMANLNFLKLVIHWPLEWPPPIQSATITKINLQRPHDPMRSRAIAEGAFRWFSMDQAINVLDSFSCEVAPPTMKVKLSRSAPVIVKFVLNFLFIWAPRLSAGLWPQVSDVRWRNPRAKKVTTTIIAFWTEFRLRNKRALFGLAAERALFLVYCIKVTVAALRGTRYGPNGTCCWYWRGIFWL